MGISIPVWGWNHRILFHIYHDVIVDMFHIKISNHTHTHVEKQNSPMFHPQAPPGTTTFTGPAATLLELQAFASAARWVMKKDLELRH